MDSLIVSSPIGQLEICEEGGYITRLSLVKDYPCGELVKKDEYHADVLHEASRQLNEYFSGIRKNFNLPISLTGTYFYKKVWHELQNIPYGSTRSYEDIAVLLGNKRLVRAVGQANHNNPIMIIIPCHRVIHKNGDISGYGYGYDVKKYLLELEGYIK